MSAAILGTISSLADTAVNAGLTVGTNRLNEKLMRESWAREDNAVQRRVADLKAAGLSPTLAAGSAAASSGPISLKTPKIDTLAAVQAYKQLEAEDVSIENAKKTGELIQKQIENYGLPDMFVALKEMFGAQEFANMIKTWGSKLYKFLFKEDYPSGSSGSSESDYNFDPKNVVMPEWFVSSAPGDTSYKLPAEYQKGFKFTTAPKSEWDKTGVTDQFKERSTKEAVRKAIGEDMYKDLMHFKDTFKGQNLTLAQEKVLLTGIATRYKVSYEYVKKYWDELYASD